MYEFFDHTADLGIRVRAATLNELFADAGRGLMAAIVENLEAVVPSDSELISISGTDRVDLMFDWLREILIRFETERKLWSSFHVEVTDSGLMATLGGEPWDPDRHLLSHEVKAITYHGLVVEQTDDGWLTEIIVDI
jgi:SHS2 domain-containing protein